MKQESSRRHVRPKLWLALNGIHGLMPLETKLFKIMKLSVMQFSSLCSEGRTLILEIDLRFNFSSFLRFNLNA
jgi:hypothetical protein